MQSGESKLEMFTIEQLVFSFWNYVVTLPEYDHVFAVQRESLTEDFVEKCKLCTESFTGSTVHISNQSSVVITSLSTVMLRIVYASVESSTSFPVIKSILLHAKRLLHWIYKEKSEFRPKIRAQLGKLLLTPNDELCTTIVSVAKDSAVTGTAALSVPIVGRSSAVDAGSTMSHVGPLLDILYQIIAGFSTADSDSDERRTQSELFVHLLQDVLLPLHKPNQMVAWRDQIPVLQVYHEPLVRCVLKLVEKDSQLRSRDTVNSGGYAKQQSVLVLAAEGILGSWPDRFDTNTPKQVLLLHELEMLLEKASKREFKSIKPSLLVGVFQ